MKFEVLILGSNSATPMYGRHPTAQLINIREQLCLVDCGEGTQMRLTKFGVKLNRIKYIFISHLHGDHYLGLMGLLSSMHLMGRNTPVSLFGPPGLSEILDLQFQYSETELRYPLTFHQTNTSGKQLVLETDQMNVFSFPLDHRIACTGFRFDEKPDAPHIDVEACERAGVPKAFFKLLKKKTDFIDSDGVLHPWQSLTAPLTKPRSYAYCSDTVNSKKYLNWIHGVDLLYHEATFLHEMQARAVETLHTTALEAGQIAQEAEACQLLIGHYSARYRDLKPLLEEAQQHFPATLLAREGDWYTV